MKNQLKQIFQTPKFVFGFVIFVFMLALAILYPLLVPGDPLEMQTAGCYKPGTYISLADAIESKQYTLKMDITSSRLDKMISQEDKDAMVSWLTKYREIDEADIPVDDAAALVEFWNANYDSTIKQKGLTNAKKQYYRKLATRMSTILETSNIIIAAEAEDGTLEESKSLPFTAFTNVDDITSKKTFILGTDNFGRDMLKELAHA